MTGPQAFSTQYPGVFDIRGFAGTFSSGPEFDWANAVIVSRPNFVTEPNCPIFKQIAICERWRGFGRHTTARKTSADVPGKFSLSQFVKEPWAAQRI